MRFLLYIISFLILSCDSGENTSTLSGCTDSLACNFDENAIVDDNESCEYCFEEDCNTYPAVYYDCEGNCIATLDNCDVCDDDPNNNCIQDCTGEWGGDAVVDGCGICDGPGAIYECGCNDSQEGCSCDGIPEGACDCEGNIDDCAGVCGGDAEFDACGVCNGSGITEGDCDCAGNICDCSDPDCIQDFVDGVNGDQGVNDNLSCGGDAQEFNYCSDTDGDGYGNSSNQDSFCNVLVDEGWVLDCEDVDDSTYCESNIYDVCDICDGPGLNEHGCCGDEVLDECGICGGDGSPIFTCWNGDLVCDISECPTPPGNYPDWDPNGMCVLNNYNDYEFNGSITSRIYTGSPYDAIEAGASGDLVAAFVDDEQRGVACADLVPDFLGGGVAFLMMIYSNQSAGEILTFQYYDLSEDRVYNLSSDPWDGDDNSSTPKTYEFISNMAIGDVIDPLPMVYCDTGLCRNSNWVNINSDYPVCMPCEFQFNTSLSISSYFFQEVTLNNDLVDPNDWVGAFNGDTCVGAKQWDISSCNSETCEVLVLGNDGTDYTEGYMQSGEIPTFKIYDKSTNSYIDATASEQIPWYTGITPVIPTLSGSFDCNSNNYFDVVIQETGESTLFIFDASIPNLDVCDQIGLFDTGGIMNSDCENPSIGEVLVGAGTWNGGQLEVTGIASNDLCDIGGPLQPGYIEYNTVLLKIWDDSEQLECQATYTTTFGSGSFNGLYTNINTITIGACE